MADRPPYLNDGKTALEQMLGLVRQQIAHALRPRPFGVIIVHALHRLADFPRLAVAIVAGAQRVIKHHDPLAPLSSSISASISDSRRAGFRPPHKNRQLLYRAGQSESRFFERKFIEMQPPVAQGDMVRFGFSAAQALIELAGRSHHGHRHLLGIEEITEGRFERFALGIEFGELGHRGSSTRFTRS